MFNFGNKVYLSVLKQRSEVHWKIVVLFLSAHMDSMKSVTKSIYFVYFRLLCNIFLRRMRTVDFLKIRC